jgi:hypothetical protein
VLCIFHAWQEQKLAPHNKLPPALAY